MINFTAAGPVRSTLRTVNSVSKPTNIAAGSDNTSAGSDNTWDNSSIASVMLVASLLVRCERPTACRGHEPDTGYDTSAHRIGATPLKIEEPVYRPRRSAA